MNDPAIPVLLDWPPPGTERLHGKLWRLRVRAVLALVMIVPALLSVMFPTPTRAYSRGLPILTSVLLWTAVLGLFVFLSVVTASAGLFDIGRAAARLGYRRGLLFEVALDHATDTQSLISGTGRYDIVRERTRTRVRSLRTLASLMLLGAALSPLPLLCIALMLALRNAADPLAFILIPVLPVVFLATTAVVVNGYAAVLIHWDRGSDVWDPSPVTTAQRAAHWIALESRDTSERSPATPPTRSGSVLVGAFTTLLAVAAFVVAAAVIVVTIGTGVFIQFRARGELYIPSSYEAAHAEFVRYLRVPRDSSITALQAGNALHELLYPTGNAGEGMREPARRYDRPLWPRGVPQMGSEGYWKMIVDGKEYNFLQPPARAAFDTLLRQPHHPALANIATLARAPSIDVTRARYADNVPSQLVGRNLFSSSDIALAATIDAATKFKAGDAAGAETKLRNMISAGMLLMDGSPYEEDLGTGARLANSGREGLIFVYRKTGQEDVARALSQARNASVRTVEFDGGPRSVESLWTVASISGAYPSIRWAAFQTVVNTARCGSLKSRLFGPSERDWSHVTGIESALVHTASDSLLLRAILSDTTRVVPTPHRPGMRRLLGVTRMVLTDRQLSSACLGRF